MSRITFAEAIKSLNPKAEFKVAEGDINFLEWLNNTTPITKEDILSEQTRLQAIEDA